MRRFHHNSALLFVNQKGGRIVKTDRQKYSAISPLAAVSEE
jgi:hypothetical protein